ncbi:MAG: hypothetical protein LUC43_05500 [Burkholderiales bacterium]|nr:hypothetical protein [Burkholderiales bacterium]
MKKRVTKIATLIACAVTVMLCGCDYSTNTAETAKQLASPILGIATPGKTTLDDFEKAVAAKRCKYEYKTVEPQVLSRINVDAGCFDLPGKPSVEATAAWRETPLNHIAIEFPGPKAPELYKEYLEALEKTYGKPDKEVNRPDMQSAVWQLAGQDMLISLVSDEGHGGHGEHIIVFSMGEEAIEKADMFVKQGMLE